MCDKWLSESIVDHPTKAEVELMVAATEILGSEDDFTDQIDNDDDKELV